MGLAIATQLLLRRNLPATEDLKVLRPWFDERRYPLDDDQRYTNPKQPISLWQLTSFLTMLVRAWKLEEVGEVLIIALVLLERYLILEETACLFTCTCRPLLVAALLVRRRARAAHATSPRRAAPVP